MKKCVISYTHFCLYRIMVLALLPAERNAAASDALVCPGVESSFSDNLL